MSLPEYNDPWLAPQPDMLPDFIIAGAMKAGTSSIHQLLQRHPDISIPEDEVHFFDLDDPMEHPDFGNPAIGVSPGVEFVKSPDKFWQWYATTLRDQVSEASIVGEDSTTYLSSRVAFSRIARQAKPIKLIVCLRQPTLRAYSNYWHMQKTRRVACSFDTLLQQSPASVLQRSCYGQQVRDLLNQIPRERVYFVVLESLKTEDGSIAKERCAFVGADPEKLPLAQEHVHSNAGIYQKSLTVQNMINACFPAQQAVNYHAAMPFADPLPSALVRLRDLAGRALSKANRSSTNKAPPMSAATKAHLDAYFSQECADVSKITDIDLNRFWFRPTD